MLTAKLTAATLLQLMRGFPPVQLFILGLVFGLLALPLVQLTSTPAVEPVAKEGRSHNDHLKADDGKLVTVPTMARLRFAHQPLSVSLKQGDKELAQKLDLSASPVEFRTGVKVSKGGNELVLAATWPEGTPDTALTVELEPDGFEIRSETRWSSGTALEEVLTFSW